ncbi:PHB depolymerase family esterase [Dyella humicola]|uniref:PHB depolymerase family esterase n=1 Tax=Dyella humicola TaxID=2992126 RepID=UPI002259A5AD|nr:PHB depolymerase family esterase [Dyella humicola]
MIWRYLLPLSMLLMPLTAAAGDPAAGRTGLLSDVTFTQYSTYASSAELARRLVSPLNALRLQQQAEASHVSVSEQPIDLARERFALYVPAHEPPDGYALLVFVPPWSQAEVPPRWIPALDRLGVILVSAAQSGNDANVLDRRDPLALLAAHNVISRYHVDPSRVYVGGFSGGSRVALRLALGYPDLFHGALLEAGSDVIGEQVPVPPRDLLYRFQEATRVVYLTGQRDAFHEDADKQSRRSLQACCVFDVDNEPRPWAGHELADGASLERALKSLAVHRPAEPGKLASCRATMDSLLSQQLDQAQGLIANGATGPARQLLDQIDTRYGGLAAPRSVELAQRLSGVP